MPVGDRDGALQPNAYGRGQVASIIIERDSDMELLVGYVPGWPGAHTQGADTDELLQNLREVIEMLLEDGEPQLESEFVDVRTIQVGVRPMRYLVVVEKAAESYGVHVPDLPGCVSVGETEEEALALIREAIELHLVDLRRRGEPIPAPSSTARIVEAWSRSNAGD